MITMAQQTSLSILHKVVYSCLSMFCLSQSLFTYTDLKLIGLPWFERRSMGQLVRTRDGRLYSSSCSSWLIYATVNDVFISITDPLANHPSSKEIILAAHTSDPNPFISPYVRYDGIVQTRWQYHSHHLEYAVVEVSSSSDSKTSNEGKRDKDLTKLLAGCRAILNNLKKIVDYDPETVKKLVVVGVLHEGKLLHQNHYIFQCLTLNVGRFTQVLYMSCVGHNMFYLRSGELRPFPENVESIHKACDLLTIIWKVKVSYHMHHVPRSFGTVG